jgi:mono/diheme cytochrome c family protein
MRKLMFSALALAMLGACAQRAPEPLEGEALVARGAYLVNNIGGCNDCHTPMTPQGPDMGRALQGSTLAFTPTIPIAWAPVAPSIAGIPASYTQEQFTAFLQTGVKPNGSHPLAPMPAFRLNEEDARAVTAYIATVPREAPQQ